MKSLQETCEEAIANAQAVIPEQAFEFSQRISSGELKDYKITADQCQKSLKNFYKSFKIFRRDFPPHLEGQKHLVAAFASTPISFSDAWNMKAEELTPEDVVSLSKAGGHFQFNQIPNGANESGSTLYQDSFARGCVDSLSTPYLQGFRHKTGSVYEEDSLSEMGVFTYATPTNSAGMMKYRFAEQLSKSLGIPLVFLVTQWFRYKTPYEKLNQWLYMTGVAKVYGEGSHPKDPIKLQLISKDEALKTLDLIIDAFKAKGDYRIRTILPEHLRLGWSYPKIQTGAKKSRLIEFAKVHGFACPGHKCGGVPFETLPDREIHIGHRISQKWNSQNSGVADVHHPYNLYLSCGACNMSLEPPPG